MVGESGVAGVGGFSLSWMFLDLTTDNMGRVLGPGVLKISRLVLLLLMQLESSMALYLVPCHA